MIPLFFHTVVMTLLFVCITLCFSDSSRPTPQRYKVIERAPQQKLKRIVALAKNDEHLKDYDFGDLDNREAYIVDINNDGELEYVFVDYQGSIGCIDLDVFVERNGKLVQLELPENLDFYHDFYNPLTKKHELFVKVQGKVYVCSGGLNREIYLWENGTCTKVCNKFWLAEQRTLFNELYAEKRYEDAFNVLHTFEAEFRNQIDPQTDLWIRNDAALAAIRSNRLQAARTLIESVKTEPAFANASAALVEAIRTNEKLVHKQIKLDQEQGTKGAYDYAWLLEYNGQDRHYALQDSTIDSLWAATVPDLQTPQYPNTYWRDDIARHFGGPGYQDKVKVEENRYIIFSGFYPHCANHRGFFWCDLQEKISIVAVSENKNTNTVVSITSRSVNFDEMPQEFYSALRSWMQEESITTKQALFYDRKGNKFPILLDVPPFDIEGRPADYVLELLEITGIDHERTAESIVKSTQAQWIRKPGVERWELDDTNLDCHFELFAWLLKNIIL